MRDVSDRWIQTAKSGGDLIATLTCHPPPAADADPFELTMASASVEQELGTGPRWSASIDVEPVVGQDTWQLVSWPGTWFELQVGWRYGPGAQEMISYGQYVHSDAPTFELRNRMSLNLADRWTDLDRARYDRTFKPSSGPRTRRVEDAVRTALGEEQPVSVRIADGGSIGGEAEWDERTTLISDLSKDGGFESYFDYDGVFVMADPPTIGRPVHIFSDGSGADIQDLTRGGRFTKYYNRVSVYPQNPDELNFTPHTATLDEPHHPLDPRNMRGLHVVYKHASPTISNSNQANRTAHSLLVKVLRQRLERDVSTRNTAHLEPGDTVGIALSATQTEPESVEKWLVAKTSFDPLTGSSSVTLTSSAEPEMTEEAA